MPLNYRMRIYKSLFFLVLLVLTACSSKQTPTDIIPKDRMTYLLTDLHVVDGSLYSAPQMPDSLYKYSMGAYTAVFQKYHTDSVQFKKSFTYYTANPDQLDEIYDNVLKIVQARIDSLNKIKTHAVPAK